MALKKRYTVGDLRFAPATAMQLCCKCGETFSATYGDYFLSPDDTVLKHCGRLGRHRHAPHGVPVG